MRRTVGAALLMLGACNKEPEVKLENATPAEVAAAASKAGAGASGSETHLQPGQWQLITDMKLVEAAGIPDAAQSALRSQVERTGSSTQCIRPEDVEKPNIFAGQNSGRCKYDSFEMKGGKIKATMTCPGHAGGEMKMTMDGDYSPRSYKIRATMDMNMPGAGQSMKMTMDTQGNRIGECTGGEGKSG